MCHKHSNGLQIVTVNYNRTIVFRIVKKNLIKKSLENFSSIFTLLMH